MLALLVVGCKNYGVRESLDEATMVSVITSDRELVLFRHALSGAYARDFVSLGPVELVASDWRDYYLWLSFWGLLPDGNYRQLPQPESVIILTDSRPFTLERETTDYADVQVSRPVYEPPIAGAGAGYFKVSEELLRAMAEDPAFSIEVDKEQFILWSDQDGALEAFRQFVQEATGF